MNLSRESEMICKDLCHVMKAICVDRVDCIDHADRVNYVDCGGRSS